MPPTAALPLTLTIDPAAPASLHAQLREGLRRAILAGRLQPGQRLPSSRLLAQDLGCARGTVLLAIEQLAAEGYLDSRAGAGVYVAAVAPEAPPLAAKPPGAERVGERGAGPPRLSGRATRRLAGGLPVFPGGVAPDAFALGRPALDLFPADLWARLLASEWRRPDEAAELPPGGDPRLRLAIAHYLAAARGFTCAAEDIIITAGAGPAIDLMARLFADPGGEAWIEEPGYQGLRRSLSGAGLRPVAVPVDDQGLSVATGRQLAPVARLAVVTPAHHYPLGVVMSLSRRLDLLRWAGDSGAVVIEDDFDGEYRYGGRPLAPLRALDGGSRVAYLGSFSRVLFPSLRLGYLVLPTGLGPAAEQMLADEGPLVSSLGQGALARFIDGGHLARHMRRTRKLYAERQAALVAAAARHLGGRLVVAPDHGGLQLIARPLEAEFDDVAACLRAATAGVAVAPLSTQYAGRPCPGLLLGYAAVPVPAIEPAIRRLAAVLGDP